MNLEYSDYLLRREIERAERNKTLRLQSQINLTRAVLWLFEHDWDLLISKNLYLIFYWEDQSVTIKLDKRIHAEQTVRKGRFEYEYLDCKDESLWSFLRRNLELHYMENYNYLYFVKGDRMVRVNCGNCTAVFIDNTKASYATYKGWDVLISDTQRLSVKGKPQAIEKRTLKVKSGVRSMSKSDLMKIRLKDVWIKEFVEFGE